MIKNAVERNLIFEVKKLVGSWITMWNSYDISLVDKLYLTDFRVTYFSPEKDGLIKGIDAVRKHHEGFGSADGEKSKRANSRLKTFISNCADPLQLSPESGIFRETQNLREALREVL